MDRRAFLAAGGVAALAPALAAARAGGDAAAAGLFAKVKFGPDGLGLDPAEYIAVLQETAGAGDYAMDYYSQGGGIEELERRFAEKLGKEAAIFVPTGTLANHLAVRRLAGANRRVLVQADSHLYCDSGDAPATLSGLSLVPLGDADVSIDRAEVERWLARSAGGRVATPVGAISIETPIRRRDHAMVDFAELEAISALAREHGIGLHLDGSRLFSLPLHNGRSVQEHAALFDTVYVSLWKHFNAASGAILAGSRDVVDGLFHVRRMFGGGLPFAWPLAAPAGKYLDRFERDYADAWDAAGKLIEALAGDDRFVFRKVANGTSRMFLGVRGIAPPLFAERLRSVDVLVPAAIEDSGEFVLQVNATLLRMPPADLAALFVAAAG